MGVNVQGWIAEEIPKDAAEKEFVGITCAACRQTHFVNATTGRVLGDNPGRNSDD
jgi:hypothetical protein